MSSDETVSMVKYMRLLSKCRLIAQELEECKKASNTEELQSDLHALKSRYRVNRNLLKSYRDKLLKNPKCNECGKIIDIHPEEEKEEEKSTKIKFKDCDENNPCPDNMECIKNVCASIHDIPAEGNQRPYFINTKQQQVQKQSRQQYEIMMKRAKEINAQLQKTMKN